VLVAADEGAAFRNATQYSFRRLFARVGRHPGLLDELGDAFTVRGDLILQGPMRASRHCANTCCSRALQILQSFAQFHRPIPWARTNSATRGLRIASKLAGSLKNSLPRPLNASTTSSTARSQTPPRKATDILRRVADPQRFTRHRTAPRGPRAARPDMTANPRSTSAASSVSSPPGNSRRIAPFGRPESSSNARSSCRRKERAKSW